jgi:hypothetical protein
VNNGQKQSAASPRPYRGIAAKSPTPRDLHNAFFGNGGEYGKLFPTRAEREAFARTPEYREIVKIQDALDREKGIA